MLPSKSIFKASLNGSLVLRPVIHATAFFWDIKLKQMQITILKWSHDFSESNKIFKVSFHCYLPNVFSKLL